MHPFTETDSTMKQIDTITVTIDELVTAATRLDDQAGPGGASDLYREGMADLIAEVLNIRMPNPAAALVKAVIARQFDPTH